MEVRTRLFPDETTEATDEQEFQYQPNHVHSPRMRSVNEDSVAPSTTTGFSLSSKASGVKSGDGSEAFTGVVSGEGAPGESCSNVAKTNATARIKKLSQKEESRDEKGETVASEGMLRTFRPNPLGPYTANRNALKFKPTRLEKPEKLKTRQQRTVFDASQISPMLQVC